MYPRRPCSTALGSNQWFSFTSLKNFLRFFVSNLISLTRCLYRYMQVNVMEVNASQRKNTLYSFQSSALFIGGHCSLSVLNTRARCHNSNGLSCDISFFLLIIRRSPFKSWSATFASVFFFKQKHFLLRTDVSLQFVPTWLTAGLFQKVKWRSDTVYVTFYWWWWCFHHIYITVHWWWYFPCAYITIYYNGVLTIFTVFSLMVMIFTWLTRTHARSLTHGHILTHFHLFILIHLLPESEIKF